MSNRERRLRVTVCGTFNGGLDLVQDAVDYFVEAGHIVLSPFDPTPIEIVRGFWFVASDRSRDARVVERRHLAAITSSDLVWLIAPDGYVGYSAAVEIAYAAGSGVPIYTSDRIAEPALDGLCRRVASRVAALERCSDPNPPDAGAEAGRVLLDPHTGARAVHDGMDSLVQTLTSSNGTTSIESRVAADARRIRQALIGLG